MLPAPDRISRADVARRRLNRIRSWLLCRVGLHSWNYLRNPDVSGKAAMYHLCRRCGREKDGYDPPSFGVVR